jgi:hypothetical protein
MSRLGLLTPTQVVWRQTALGNDTAQGIHRQIDRIQQAIDITSEHVVIRRMVRNEKVIGHG